MFDRPELGVIGFERNEIAEVVVAFLMIGPALFVDQVLARQREHDGQLQAEQLRVLGMTMRTVQDIVGNALMGLYMVRAEAEGPVGYAHRFRHAPSMAICGVIGLRRDVSHGIADSLVPLRRSPDLRTDVAAQDVKGSNIGSHHPPPVKECRMPLSQNRRSFLAHVTNLASVAGVAIMGGSRANAGTHSSPFGRAPVSAQQKWNIEWLDSFKGKHKQVYDLMWHTLRSNTLNPPMNYFDVHKELSRLEFPDVNVVIGANSTAFPINASDALWAKYKLGERYKINDPDTGQPAIRNVYLGLTTGDTRSTVRTLQARGAVFMMCNNALRGIAADYARESGATTSEVHAELVAGLNPGVKVVPALTWAVGALQERGFTYEKL